MMNTKGATAPKDKRMTRVNEIQLEQGSPEWLSWRNQGVGASDVPIITGKSPYKTAYALWREKTGIDQPKEIAEYAKMMGANAEEEAKEIIHSATGRVFQPVCFEMATNPKHRASLDGWDYDNDEALEVKFMATKEVEALTKGAGIREDHLHQMYFQMHVMGIKEMHYFVIAKDGSHFTTLVEQTSKENLETIIFKVDAFLDDVKNRKAPPISQDDYMEVEAPDVVHLLRSLAEQKALIDDHKRVEAKLRKALIAIAPHGKLQVDNIKFFQTKGRVTCNYKKCCEDNMLDTTKYMAQGKPSWSLRIAD